MSDLVAVFNTDDVPLGHISLEQAVTRICQGKAWPLKVDRTRSICCQDWCLYVPLAIQVKGPETLPGSLTDAADLTRESLLLRDGYCCSYCGRTAEELGEGEFFNKDHVVPRSQGGPDSFHNLVLACNTCNSRKRNRTPEQARMPLLQKPYVPSRAEISHLRRIMHNSRG